MVNAVKRKVAAFIIRTSPTGISELLLHSFAEDASLPMRLLGGGVQPAETPEQALYRELKEETGLEALQLVRKLGVQRYYKPFIQAHVVRHDYLLRLQQEVPDPWEVQVGGEGADAGGLFRFHWVSSQLTANVDEEHRRFITPEYLPELF